MSKKIRDLFSQYNYYEISYTLQLFFVVCLNKLHILKLKINGANVINSFT